MKKIELKAYVTKIADNRYRAIASTDAVDRYGDVIDQASWQTVNYMKNPVMLWAHDSSQLPVARTLSLDTSQQGKLITEFEFADATMSPIAPYVKNSYDGGFLNALSVGFMTGQSEGNILSNCELLEISFVPVPANQEALRLAITKGFDLGDIKGDVKIEKDEKPAEEVPPVVPPVVEQKSGAVLSKKSKALVEKAIGHLCDLADSQKEMSDHHKSAVSTLEELMASTSPEGGADDDDDEEDDDEKGLALSEKDLRDIRSALNIATHQTSFATSLVKDAIAKVGQ